MTESSSNAHLPDLIDDVRCVVREELKTALSFRDCQLLTREEVAALLRIDVRTLRRMVLEGTVPKPIRIGTRLVRWRMLDLVRELGLQGEAS